MKKQGFPILVMLTVAFAAFTLGFFLGRNRVPEPVTLSVPAKMLTAPTESAASETEAQEPAATVSFPIDINLAQEDDLMLLPGIGQVLARRILSYREELGTFSCVEELLNVEGIGNKRFEDIYDLISVGG